MKIIKKHDAGSVAALVGLAALGGIAIFNAAFGVNVTAPYRIIEITDGDTVVIEANFLPPELGHKLGLRIVGIDTGEKGGRAECDYEREMGEKAHRYAEDKIATARKIDINLIGWDKYGGRVIGEVIVDGRSLGNLLIQEKLAKPYDGQSAKTSWCKKK